MRRALVATGVVLLAGGCAGAAVPFPAEPRPGSVYHSLQKPDGEGPFPAVVLLHTCGGLQQHVLEWAQRLRAHEYVALVLDSFTPRGEKSVCVNWRVSLDEVVADAEITMLISDFPGPELRKAFEDLLRRIPIAAAADA